MSVFIINVCKSQYHTTKTRARDRSFCLMPKFNSRYKQPSTFAPQKNSSLPDVVCTFLGAIFAHATKSALLNKYGFNYEIFVAEQKTAVYGLGLMFSRLTIRTISMFNYFG